MYSAYKLNKLCGSQQTEKFFKRWTIKKDECGRIDVFFGIYILPYVK